MKKVSILMMLIIAAMAVFVVGCGSSDDSDGGGGPTKEEYIASADKICAKSDKEIAALGKKLSADPSQKETVKLITADLIPALESRAKELGALERPSADEDELESYFQDIDDGISTVADDPAGLVKDDAKNPFQAANDAAAEYGFEVCGANI